MTTAGKRETWERTVLGAGWSLMPGGQSWTAGRHDVRRRPDGQFSCCTGGVFGDVNQLRLHLLENGPGLNHFDDLTGRIACMAATGQYVSPGDWTDQRVHAEIGRPPGFPGVVSDLGQQARAAAGTRWFYHGPDEHSPVEHFYRDQAELRIPEQAGPIARLCMQPPAPDCCQGCGMGAVETGLASGWLPGERLCAYCAALEAERGGQRARVPAARSSWQGRLPEAARLAGAALLLLALVVQSLPWLLAGLSLLILAMMTG